MDTLLPSRALIERIEQAEADYTYDRMLAIRERSGNPEGVEIRRVGSALLLYSETMPWPGFNTVKGLTGAEIAQLDEILDFYRSKGRNPQFELVPSSVDVALLQALSERGFYQSGFHTSMFIDPTQRSGGEPVVRNAVAIRIAELREDQFERYAEIHCRGFGLPENGIPHIANNNRVLHGRPGWKFYVAYVDEKPAAAAVMFSFGDTASLTFAATLPEYRGHGLHNRLLGARLGDAQNQGCKLVVGQCAFLSASHRNMERAGMRIGYVRATWTARPTT